MDVGVVGRVCACVFFVFDTKKKFNLTFKKKVVATAASLHGGSHFPAALFDSVSRRVTTATNPSSLSLSHPLVERGGGGVRSGFVRYEDEDDDEFSSNEEGSDSDQTGGVGGSVPGGVVGAGVRPARINKALLQNRGKIPSNARVNYSFSHLVAFQKI